MRLKTGRLKGGPYVSPQGAPLGALVARSGRNSARQSTIELLRALGAQE